MSDFPSRFKNWLRWCSDHAGEPHSPCGSAEGRWHSPQIWEPDVPGRNMLNPVDVVDAVLVNRAYVALRDYDRRVLKYVYFRQHWRPSWMAQKLGCHYTQIYSKLLDAKARMRTILDTIDEKEYFSRRSPVAGNRSQPSMEAAASI